MTHRKAGRGRDRDPLLDPLGSVGEFLNSIGKVRVRGLFVGQFYGDPLIDLTIFHYTLEVPVPRRPTDYGRECGYGVVRRRGSESGDGEF